MEKQYEIVKLLTSRLTNGANKIGFSKNERNVKYLKNE